MNVFSFTLLPLLLINANNILVVPVRGFCQGTLRSISNPRAKVFRANHNNLSTQHHDTPSLFISYSTLSSVKRQLSSLDQDGIIANHTESETFSTTTGIQELPNETLSSRRSEKEDDKLTSSTHETNTIQSIVLLNFVAVIWGTQHSFIKMVVDDCDASAFSFSRFALAALIATVGPSLFSKLNNDNNDGEPSTKIISSNESETIISGIDGNDDNHGQGKSALTLLEAVKGEENQLAWRWGIEMGLWMFLGYAFQAIGLEYTTAQRSGFLLYLNIKLVPLFAYLIYQRNISIPTWISALTALTGTALLTFDGSTYDLNIGDVWSIAAAAASAMFILRLEFATKAVPNSSKLNSYSLVVVSIAALLWCLCDGIINNTSAVVNSIGELSPFTTISLSIESTWSNVAYTITKHPLELVYLGGVTTALANYIQTKAQKGISAERASIIYALDPVYGAFFAFAILGEQLTEWGIAGASLITIAAATNAFLDLSDNKR